MTNCFFEEGDVVINIKKPNLLMVVKDVQEDQRSPMDKDYKGWNIVCEWADKSGVQRAIISEEVLKLARAG